MITIPNKYGNVTLKINFKNIKGNIRNNIENWAFPKSNARVIEMQEMQNFNSVYEISL
jgi:hypothetical protein